MNTFKPKPKPKELYARIKLSKKVMLGINSRIDIDSAEEIVDCEENSEFCV